MIHFQRFAALAMCVAVSVVTQWLVAMIMSCIRCHTIPYNYHIITMVNAVNSSVCNFWKIVYNLFIQELGKGNTEET